MPREKKFRENLELFLESYRNENNIKGGPSTKKIVEGINSQDLHNMAKNFWKTKNSYDTMPKKGGKRSRGRRRRRKKKTRKKQRGGQLVDELFAFSSAVVIMVGAALTVHFLWRESSPFTSVETPEDSTDMTAFGNEQEYQAFLASRPGTT